MTIDPGKTTIHGTVTIRTMKYIPFISISLVFIILLPGCGYREGYYTSRENVITRGFILFEVCRDEYNRRGFGSCLTFKKSMVGPGTAIPYSYIRSFAHEGILYRIIPVARTSGRTLSGTDYIAGKIVEEGRVTLLEYCSTRYQSTMFTSKKFDIVELILAKNGENAYQFIPLDPGQFIAFSQRFFNDNPSLVEEIKKTNYRHAIKNPKPGFATEYEMADPDQVRAFVRKYNQRFRAAPPH